METRLKEDENLSNATILRTILQFIFVGNLLQILLWSPQVAALEGWQGELESRLQSQSLPRVYAWLEGVSPYGDSRGEYHRWLGQMALQLGNYHGAIEHLEQVALLAPLDLGSRLELSIAYAEVGNPEAARASLAALRHYAAGVGLPSAAAERIARLEQRLANDRSARQYGMASRIRGTLSIAEGYDSNANLGSSQRSIPLNLWGELPLRLELADQSMAQASRYTQLDTTLNMSLSAVQSVPHWTALAGASLRRYDQLESLHRRDLYVGGQWRPPGRRQQASLLGVYQRVGDQEGSWSFNANYRRLWTPRLMMGIGGVWQQEPANRDSHKLHAGLWLNMWKAVVWGQLSWQFRPERTAGDTWRAKVGVDSPVWRWRRLGFNAYGDWEYRQDTRAYNEAFFGDQVRSETTISLGGAATYPLTDSLDAVLDAFWEQTDADLALFERRRVQVEARLVWRW